MQRFVIEKEVDFKFNSEQGKLVQLVHEGYSQVNVVISSKGTSRGGHYHKKTKEAFFVVSGHLKLLLNKNEVEEVYEYSMGDFFEIQVGVNHVLNFLEDSILVALYDVPIESQDGTKDIYKG